MMSSPVLLSLSPTSPLLLVLLFGSPVSVVVIPELVGSALSAELGVLVVVIVVLASVSPVSPLVVDPEESLAQPDIARSTSPVVSDRMDVLLVDIVARRQNAVKKSHVSVGAKSGVPWGPSNSHHTTGASSSQP
jgi:hypothetical protein